VTLEVKHSSIVVLGINGAIAEAARTLREYEGRLHEIMMESVSVNFGDGAVSKTARRIPIEKAMLELKLAGKRSPACVASLSPVSTTSQQPVENMLQGAVLKELPPAAACPKKNGNYNVPFGSGDFCTPTGACPACGCANFCAYCGERTERSLGLRSFGSCKTCGAANFCASCGQPTSKKNKGLNLNTSFKAPYSDSPFGIYDLDCTGQNQMLPIQGMQGDNGQSFQFPNGMMAVMLPAGIQMGMNMTMVPYQQNGYPMPQTA
jgi:hypothetical protein